MTLIINNINISLQIYTLTNKNIYQTKVESATWAHVIGKTTKQIVEAINI